MFEGFRGSSPSSSKFEDEDEGRLDHIFKDEVRTRVALILSPRTRRGRGLLTSYVRGRGEDEESINAPRNFEVYPRKSSNFEDESEGQNFEENAAPTLTLSYQLLYKRCYKHHLDWTHVPLRFFNFVFLPAHASSKTNQQYDGKILQQNTIAKKLLLHALFNYELIIQEML